MKKNIVTYNILTFITVIFLVACYTTSASDAGRSSGSTTTTTTTQANTVIIFYFDGPQNVNVTIYRNNQLQQTITSGNTARVTVPNGTHTFEAQLGTTGTAKIDTTRRQLQNIDARGSNINVNITARSIPMENIRITDFSLSNATQSASNASYAVSVMYVNADGLNVRSSGSPNATRLDTVPRNTRVEVIERTNTAWVRIRYGNGRTGWVNSSYLSSTMMIARPSTPTGLRASAITSTTCTLHWNTVSGATGYYVYWSSTPNGNYVRAGTITAPPPRDFIQMARGSNNYFRVTAFNNTGESAQSSYITVTTRN